MWATTAVPVLRPGRGVTRRPLCGFIWLPSSAPVAGARQVLTVTGRTPPVDNCFPSFSTKAGSLKGLSLMSRQRTQACASMRKCRATAGCRNRYTDRRLPVAARDRELPLCCLASRTLRVLSICQRSGALCYLLSTGAVLAIAGQSG